MTSIIVTKHFEKSDPPSLFFAEQLYTHHSKGYFQRQQLPSAEQQQEYWPSAQTYPSKPRSPHCKLI